MVLSESKIMLILEICRLCPSFETTRMEQSKWISTHYPRKSVKKAPQEQSTCHLNLSDIGYLTAVISRPSKSGPEYFLLQRPDTGLLAGLWDFPNVALEESEVEDSSKQEILREYLESLGFRGFGNFLKKGSSLHIFTHIRRTSQVYTVEVLDSLLDLHGKWATEEEITDMAVSELGRKVLRLALGMEKKRNSSAEDEKIKAKSRKTVKLEKGQTTLSFVVTRKTKVE